MDRGTKQTFLQRTRFTASESHQQRKHTSFLKTPVIHLLAKGIYHSASHLQTASRLDYWDLRKHDWYRICSNSYVFRFKLVCNTPLMKLLNTVGF